MTKPAFKPKYILWVDLEMTGLNPTKDVIQEVGAIITDWDFKELGRYESIVKQPRELVEQLMNENPWFLEYEGNRQAFLDTAEQGKPLEQVEAELISFIDEHIGTASPVLLAGNSIHMDRRFIDTYWPNLSKLLHYRMLDVSAWKVVFEGKYKKKFAKPETHRAFEDIRGSIEELKYYLKKVR